MSLISVKQKGIKNKTDLFQGMAMDRIDFITTW
jgi:hypothetical protein